MIPVLPVAATSRSCWLFYLSSRATPRPPLTDREIEGLSWEGTGSLAQEPDLHLESRYQASWSRQDSGTKRSWATSHQGHMGQRDPPQCQRASGTRAQAWGAKVVGGPGRSPSPPPPGAGCPGDATTQWGGRGSARDPHLSPKPGEPAPPPPATVTVPAAAAPPRSLTVPLGALKVNMLI